MKLHEVEVLERERFGDHALLRYRWTGAPPEPGQFVMVRTMGASLDPFLPRPLFAHDYDGEVMSLLFQIRGRGTALLAAQDANLLVSDPRGRGYVVDDGPVALVGGGVWVSPLKLLASRLRRSGIEHDVYLEIPVGASGAYAAWISESYPNATLVPTNGAADASRAVLDRVGDLSRYAGLYVSGPAGMLDAAKERASASVVPAQLAVRERMACASGSCYGCAVPVWEAGERAYARVCVEGPVFPGEVLAW